MSTVKEGTERELSPPPYKTIARRIGIRLRDFYDQPEADALPMEHVELLLKLRHKERDRSKASGRA